MKNEKNIQGQIEAILLASGDPVSGENLAKFLKIDQKKLQEEVGELEEKYQKTNSGLALVRKKDQIQLVSSADFSAEVADFLQREINEKISQSAAEVLAIVAYRGPISRAEVDYIRGVNCGFLLRSLALRGLIDKKDNPLDSRSFVYEASLDFLKSLGISKLEELSDYAILKKKGESVFAELKKSVRESVLKNNQE